jgi:hypothetical protein
LKAFLEGASQETIRLTTSGGDKTNYIGNFDTEKCLLFNLAHFSPSRLIKKNQEKASKISEHDRENEFR